MSCARCVVFETSRVLVHVSQHSNKIRLKQNKIKLFMTSSYPLYLCIDPSVNSGSWLRIKYSVIKGRNWTCTGINIPILTWAVYREKNQGQSRPESKGQDPTARRIRTCVRMRPVDGPGPLSTRQRRSIIHTNSQNAHANHIPYCKQMSRGVFFYMSLWNFDMSLLFALAPDNNLLYFA